MGDGLAATHRRDPADYLLFLGDHFYPDGLEEREAEARIGMNLVAPFCTFLDLSAPLGAQLEASCGVAPAARLPIPVLAVLGNHDWKAPESPDLQQDLVPQYLANWRLRKGGAWVEETGAGVSLVLFDSTPGRARGEVHVLRDALASARGPWRVVVSHHPIDATAKSEALRQAIAEAGVPVHLWLAGHEHNLQLGEPGPPGPALQVIAGAGSHPTGLKYDLPGRRVFRRSLGYARVDLVSGEASEDELVVSLVAVRPFPAARWQPARLAARFAVAQGGRVRAISEAPSDPPVREAGEEEPFE
jgi:calcineurin-like phosphoesterase family protein